MHRRATLSSGQEIVTTPSVRLMVYEYRQDDPRKCTSARLRKFHLANKLATIKQVPHSSIVLNPTSQTRLSIDDRPLAENHGIVALDCSWNLSERVFQQRIPGENRKLPALLAGNPVNYAALGKLNTAEALAASLFITGYPAQGEKVLAPFKWGKTFLTLNLEPLRSYAETSSDKLGDVELEFFPAAEG